MLLTNDKSWLAAYVYTKKTRRWIDHISLKEADKVQILFANGKKVLVARESSQTLVNKEAKNNWPNTVHEANYIIYII